jgi:hypothetical protein
MVMTSHMRPYDHPARQLTADARALGVCSVCPRPVAVGLDGRLRHEGEAVPRLVTDPEDAATVTALAELILASFEKLPPWEVTDADRARVAAEELFLAGAARRRRAAWRPPFRRAA